MSDLNLLSLMDNAPSGNDLAKTQRNSFRLNAKTEHKYNNRISKGVQNNSFTGLSAIKESEYDSSST